MREMFDDVVERYDLVNGLLSLGLDRRWRRAAVRAAAAARGDAVLDLGCGTGELSRALADGSSAVVGLDVSAGMLRAAAAHPATHVRLVQGSAFALPFRDGAFDAIASAFVLRNLSDLPGAFAELARVAAPGGRLAIVDITEPSASVLRRPFDLYFGTAAPALGAVFGKREAYRYLARSLAQLPSPQEVVTLLEEAGFRPAAARPLTGGMVTLFTAARPDAAA